MQLYPGDVLSNPKLSRCTDAAMGAWFKIMCVLHGGDEYGVVRWPLADLIRAAGVQKKSVMELVEKEVLKGGDKGCKAYIYTPRHAGREGEPVTLINACKSPCWYSSRMVRDEYVRQKRGQSTRFSEENQPPNATPFRRHDTSPKVIPKGGIGRRQGDGSSASSSSSSSPPPEDISPKPPDGPPPKPLVDLATAQAYAATGMVRMTADEVAYWWHARNGVGWIRGGGSTLRIVSWQSDLAGAVEWVREAMRKGRGKGSGGGFSSNDVSL